MTPFGIGGAILWGVGMKLLSDFFWWWYSGPMKWIDPALRMAIDLIQFLRR